MARDQRRTVLAPILAASALLVGYPVAGQASVERDSAGISLIGNFSRNRALNKLAGVGRA
jgi:hypothetical protein